MMNPMRLIKMVRKWQRVAALGRRRIMAAAARAAGEESCAAGSSLALASRGHVFVYTADGKRFMVPLKYLTSGIFRELLRMSEEEFGLPADGPITLPCGALCMERVISLLRGGGLPAPDVERAVAASVAGACCTAALVGTGSEVVNHLHHRRHQQQQQQQQCLVLYGF